MFILLVIFGQSSSFAEWPASLIKGDSRRLATKKKKIVKYNHLPQAKGGEKKFRKLQQILNIPNLGKQKQFKVKIVFIKNHSNNMLSAILRNEHRAMCIIDGIRMPGSFRLF